MPVFLNPLVCVIEQFIGVGHGGVVPLEVIVNPNSVRSVFMGAMELFEIMAEEFVAATGPR